MNFSLIGLITEPLSKLEFPTSTRDYCVCWCNCNCGGVPHSDLSCENWEWGEDMRYWM